MKKTISKNGVITSINIRADQKQFLNINGYEVSKVVRSLLDSFIQSEKKKALKNEK